MYRPGSTQRSGFHRKIEKILDDLGINYISEKEFYPYAIDMYLPEWHIGIEADGPLHNKAKDKIRDDKILSDYGVVLLRIPIKGFSVNGAKKDIISFIIEHSETWESRKQSAGQR